MSTGINHQRLAVEREEKRSKGWASRYSNVKGPGRRGGTSKGGIEGICKIKGKQREYGILEAKWKKES